MNLLIDNYDSFSYNLYQLIGSTDPDIKVIRNDALTCEEMEALKPSRLIISPGPGWPKDAGRSEEAVQYFKGKIPILGVCLGHQAICEVYGATVTYASRLMHGKQSICTVEDDPIFAGLSGEGKLKVARYHSLSAKKETIPEELSVIAVSDDDGEIMAVKHKDKTVYGMQFHPESILTPEGVQLLSNFIAM